MLRLPPIKGRYSVGATTFVTSVRPARVFGSAKRRGNDASSPNQLEPVLCMEEVAFTAYYPADTSSVTQKGLDWLLRPASVSLEGYAVFAAISAWILWPIIYFVGIFIKIPVYANAPLLRPAFGRSASGSGDAPPPDQWPLVIFSHGLGGSRTAYSHLCSHLAASGKVVLAIEHRDASGHACVTRSWLDNGQKVPRPIYYLKENQAIWDGGPSNKERVQFALRIEQLDFRQNEIYTAYTTFRDFLEKAGSHVNLETIDDGEVHHSWTLIDDEMKLSPIKYQEDITLVGHSFGGCTVLSILSTESPPGHEAMPTTRALLLDPWLEPLPAPGPKPHWRTSPVLEGLLVINSEAFTIWEPHFSRLKEVVTAFGRLPGKIITLVGSKHQSFSDFPILPPARSKEAVNHLDTIVSASLAFLDSDLEQFLKEAPTRTAEVLVVGVKDDGKPKRKLAGDVGDIITHWND